MPKPRKVEATVAEIVQYGEDVFSVRMEVPQKYTRFRPGQFTHLTLDGYDPSNGFWPESRVFSIASSPGSGEIRIVYSVKGSYTARMKDELVVGRTCWLKLPYGDFVVDDRIDTERVFVMIAGGTGLSPFIPYLLQDKKNEKPRKICLYYGLRHPSLEVFGNELEYANKRLSGLNVRRYSEAATEDNDYFSGPLSINHIIEETSEVDDPIFYISGPPGMINGFRASLSDSGIAENRIRTDEWE